MLEPVTYEGRSRGASLLHVPMQQLSVHDTTAPETSMQEPETSESSQEMTQEPSIEDLFYEQARRLEAKQRVDYYL